MINIFYANYFYIFNSHLKMTYGRWKRGVFFSLVFMTKSMSKKLLMTEFDCVISASHMS